MLDCSELIVEAMKYIEKKMEVLNPKSVDINSLRNKVKIQIVANINRIALLECCDVYKEIDNIFNMQLREELSRFL